MLIDLSGIWQATDDLGVQSKAGKPGYRPDGWQSLSVPGHWQQAPVYGRYAGRLLYRRSFQWEGTLAPHETARLRLCGLFYTAKVWFNGAFVGEHQGYFLAEMYDVTRHLRPGENVVLVELDSPTETDRHAQRKVVGVFSQWEQKPPQAEPGGIWREVALEISHGVVPERLVLRAQPDGLPPAPLNPAELPAGDAPSVNTGPITAAVGFDLEFSAVAEGKLTWNVTVTPETFEGEAVTLSGSQPVRRGWNRLASGLVLPDPRFWWTWDHGRPDLYRFRLELSHDGGPVQAVERLFGVCKVELKGWQFYLNGRRIFVRGANYGPTDIRLASARREDFRRDLELARDANLNLLRVLGHVSKPEFYEEASRQGVLLWQDFPLHGLYARSVADDARRQARGMVEQLGHWPAIGLWCCHADPIRAVDRQDPSVLDRSLATLSRVAGNWNMSSLAPSLREVIRTADPTRSCIAHPGELSGADGKLHQGWYGGGLSDLDRTFKLFPDRARFVTEFGAQSFPGVEHSRRFVRGPWPNLNWSELAERHMLQPQVLERHVPHTLAHSFEGYVEATQEYQASLCKAVIENLRRRKYEPCGGMLQALLADCAPGITWSLVDYWRQPKAAYRAVQQAFSPVYIMADWPQQSYPVGGRVKLRVYLVNDRYRNYSGTWSWALQRGAGTLQEESQPVYLAPDRLAAAGSIDWEVPAGLLPGPLDLLLTLQLDDGDPVVNRYTFRVVPPQGK